MSLVTPQEASSLDRSMPAAKAADLGTNLAELQAKHNILVGRFNALLAKLDADAGVTDTNYASTLTAASATIS